MNVNVTILDRATPAIRAFLSRATNSQAIHAEMGLAVESLVLRRIRTVLIPRGNKMGAPSTGFWQKAAASVKGTSTATEATVSIPDRGVALHYYGGTVKPSGRISSVTGRAITRLAIPLDASAYGKSPGDFPKGSLTLIGNVLARKLGRGKDAPFTALFALVRSVHINPHPDILPPDAEIGATAAKAGKNYLLRNLK